MLSPFTFEALTFSEEALCILTFGNLRIFWQLLEPGIIFSEICLASFRDLSFRPRHNYSCFGSILATVTVLFLGCDWRLLCPSQWGRKAPAASGPWLREACSPRGQGLKGIGSENHSHPPVLADERRGGDDLALECIPRHPRSTPGHTHLFKFKC